ncbi:hypothetical protein PCE1_002056 [Barthelona sp. PCE]
MNNGAPVTFSLYNLDAVLGNEDCELIIKQQWVQSQIVLLSKAIQRIEDSNEELKLLKGTDEWEDEFESFIIDNLALCQDKSQCIKRLEDIEFILSAQMERK